MRQLFTQTIRRASNQNNLNSILSSRNINTEAKTILNNLKIQFMAGVNGYDRSGESVKNTYYTKDTRDSLEDLTNKTFNSIENFNKTENGTPKQIIDILSNLLNDPDIKSQLANTLDPFDKKSTDAIAISQANVKPALRPLNKHESLSAFDGIKKNMEKLLKTIETQDLHSTKIAAQSKKIEF
ncbi:MAG: hypothetical protein K0R98_1808 [Rickettsiaceae bacterium]|jgi:hypothetical protein|nr:hypothetical protein [Rickettsiaceae bacterium]